MSSNKKRDSRQYIVINEERLINEVQKRPILYDKALKGYRKPTIRERSWQEVATLLESTVDESKKRWRSLRDAFMKQYKQFASDEPSCAKKKKWLFYDQMEFLRPYLELSNDMSLSREEYMDEYIVSKQELRREVYFSNDDSKGQIMKGNVIIQQAAHQMLEDDDEEILEDAMDVGEVPDGGVSEEVGHVLGDGDDEDQLEEHEEVIDIYEEISEIFPNASGIGTTSDVNDGQDSPEDILPTHHTSQQQQHLQNQTQPQQQVAHPTQLIVKSCLNNDSQQYATQNHTQHMIQHQTQLNAVAASIEDTKDHASLQQPGGVLQQLDIGNVSQFGLNPDERFLLSCSPILKRLSHKKNALARLKIQQILYEIEFGDNNVVEPQKLGMFGSVLKTSL